MLKRLLFAATLLAWFGTSPAMASPDGAKLYVRNCAACHGENGNGGIGVPLALRSFQAGISDDYLRKTIRNGRPGRVMPAFSQLDESEIEAIVRHVRAWNKGASATYSVQRVKGDPVRGKKLFAQRLVHDGAGRQVLGELAVVRYAVHQLLGVGRVGRFLQGLQRQGGVIGAAAALGFLGG